MELTRGDQTVVFDAAKLVTGAIGCIVRIESVTRPRDLGPDDAQKDPYYEGECGWRFAVVEKLAEPIPCKGAQGLWPLASLLGKDMGTPQAGRAW